jgi:hypothetical protein
MGMSEANGGNRKKRGIAWMESRRFMVDQVCLTDRRCHAVRKRTYLVSYIIINRVV